jgi:hypothetical protein
MPLAYYAAEASRTFWEDHWTGRDIGDALAIAERSPLTQAIEAALAPASAVLEAGCDLGQHVVLPRRGHTASTGRLPGFAMPAPRLRCVPPTAVAVRPPAVVTRRVRARGAVSPPDGPLPRRCCASSAT